MPIWTGRSAKECPASRSGAQTHGRKKGGGLVVDPPCATLQSARAPALDLSCWQVRDKSKPHRTHQPGRAPRRFRRRLAENGPQKKKTRRKKYMWVHSAGSDGEIVARIEKRALIVYGREARRTPQASGGCFRTNSGWSTPSARSVIPSPGRPGRLRNVTH